ncbi:unnamed protein product [Durusdinium trenchii]|uniref:Uncharacterized protein n=1 Tax=Durusdinium trenchii TaxID=1381693 RepID=A0ABP0IUH7_9DINO
MLTALLLLAVLQLCRSECNGKCGTSSYGCANSSCDSTDGSYAVGATYAEGYAAAFLQHHHELLKRSSNASKDNSEVLDRFLFVSGPWDEAELPEPALLNAECRGILHSN